MNILKKSKSIKSAFDSTTFDADVSIHVDRIVGSASISPSGRDVVLASTDGLDIIDLDFPLNPPRHLRNGLPWLVADVQWSPFAARDYWVVSTANQKALVWNLNKQEDANDCVEHTLSAHTRAITDINFSAHHPDILATCAVDGYVHVWDLRRPKKPVITFTDWFGGATQIKCNRQDSHILASSHDRWLRIWDERKGASPIQSINAHASKIYGVDWNRTSSTRVVTCSLDKTIKFWDYASESDEPERIIRTDFPVWRARHTPFGHGLLAMPQDAPGNLHLYDQRLLDGESIDSVATAVNTFLSCGNAKVKEFLWRSRGSITDHGVDDREFQLVSWGDDNKLRLQTVEPRILAGVGYVKGDQINTRLNITRKGAAYKTFRDVEKTATEKKAPTITGPQPSTCGPKINTLGAGIKMIYTSKIFKPYRDSSVMRGAAMKTRHTCVEEEKEQKQIGWMSGIKFSRPENEMYPQRRLSLIHPDFEDNRGWDGLESLHDEIIRIHRQLPTIAFDNIDLDQRMVVVSTNGPWADDESSINITLTIVFPEHYPEIKAPVFTIGKNSLMSNATYMKLEREVQKIADSSVAHSQGCLETVLRYLLGEIDLEASTFFKDVGDFDGNFSLTAESSSDDEEVNSSNSTSANMYHGLDPGTADRLPPANRYANVPLPRLCGALFSANGILVCFFPPKENKVKSLLATLTAQNHSRLRDKPYYESFGRLQNNNFLLGPRAKSLSLGSEASSDSEDSDFSDTSDSSDSDYFVHYGQPMFLRFLGGSFRRPSRHAPPTSDSQIYSGAGTTTGTGTGTVRRGSRPKNIVVLHPLADILPSKVELAKDYVVFGHGPNVCEYNAAVAENHGYRELADVWRYAALILYNRMSVKFLEHTDRREPIITTARDTVLRNQCINDHNVVIGASYNVNAWCSDFVGRISWGTHPLAGSLIRDLFIHFERQADIQMLAMLSCILTEPLTRPIPSIIPIMKQPQTTKPSNISPLSLESYPIDVCTYTMHDKPSNHSNFSTPRLFHTPSGVSDCLDLLPGTFATDPSYPCGETHSLTSARINLESINRNSQGLSTFHQSSGKSFRPVHSVGFSTFAAGFSRFTSSSSSPPKPSSNLKKTAPVEQILTSFAPTGITWGNTTVIRGAKGQAEGNRYSTDYFEEEIPAPCTGIRVDMKLSDPIDDTGCLITPLLTHHAALYSGYRAAYARALYLWDLPVARLEILKFDALDHHPMPADASQHKAFKSYANFSHRLNEENGSPIVLGKKDSQLSELEKEGLDVVGYCIQHESRLEPLVKSSEGGAIGRCGRCKTVQRQLKCTICLEPVSAIFSPCLSCGCISHIDCLAAYHSEGNTYCPGGCECNCSVYADMGIVESWEVMTSSLLFDELKRSQVTT